MGTREVFQEVERYFTVVAWTVAETAWAQYAKEVVLAKPETERTEGWQEVAAMLMVGEQV